jgi:hypothetical protein
MNQDSRKRLRIVVLAVSAAAIAFVVPTVIAGLADVGWASCGGASHAGCPAAMATDRAGAGPMQMAHQSCAMLSGTVTSIDKRDGSLTVKVKPAATGGDVASKALNQVKVGDNLSIALMLNKDGAPASPSAVQAAKYTCPMHPEVTSDKPGRCSKCGMALVHVKTAPK